MASFVTKPSLTVLQSIRQSLKITRKPQRALQSTTTLHAVTKSRREKDGPGPISVLAKPNAFSERPLARLSTSSILRTLLLSAFFNTPFLFRPGLAIFEKIANSRSPWLNPDRNPLLRAGIYHLVYKQFCAGRNQAEIERASSEIRRLGFSSIV